MPSEGQKVPTELVKLRSGNLVKSLPMLTRNYIKNFGFSSGIGESKRNPAQTPSEPISAPLPHTTYFQGQLPIVKMKQGIWGLGRSRSTGTHANSSH